jgi:hypothetical protein
MNEGETEITIYPWEFTCAKSGPPNWGVTVAFRPLKTAFQNNWGQPAVVKFKQNELNSVKCHAYKWYESKSLTSRTAIAWPH